MDSALSNTLQPGGCLTVATGQLNPATGAVNITMVSLPQIRPIKTDGTSTNFTYPGLDLTILHFWGKKPPADRSCTVLEYATQDSLRPNLVSPYRAIEIADIKPEGVLYSFEFSYTVGCPSYPSTVGDGSFYLQIYGQSHTKKSSDVAKWNPIPFSIDFPLLEINGTADALVSVIKGSDIGQNGAKLVLECPRAVTTTTTTTALPSKTSEAFGFKSFWAALFLGLLLVTII
ncbi:hypothetical protein BDR26DRAFT_858130 [Obelidium mucronatum]|nr:hypothetical protein BDR26DRAFT_858130 [Obelidium mucronatum]